ncbi:MAG: hypothetical protein M0026_08125 [Nocardiopsaceae bacterium]|nr:hypothetical protein [Nocardiopsaceae bacterium]
MNALWPVLLLGLGGLFIGGAVSMWTVNKVVAAGLALGAAIAVAAGVLRLGLFGS